jgi:hypothetical protein
VPAKSIDLNMERETTTPSNAQDELRFQVSLMRLVYHGSVDAGPRVSAQIAQIEQMLEK